MTNLEPKTLRCKDKRIRHHQIDLLNVYSSLSTAPSLCMVAIYYSDKSISDLTEQYHIYFGKSGVDGSTNEISPGNLSSLKYFTDTRTVKYGMNRILRCNFDKMPLKRIPSKIRYFQTPY